MGVSGSGKSLIGAWLAQELHVEFVEGDDLHPPDNDRKSWLMAIAARLREAKRAGTGLVASCSALKRGYRDLIRSSGDARVQFVYLAGTKALLAERMANRRGHFMPPALLESQLDTLEEPAPDERAWVCDIGDTPDTIVASLVKRSA